MNVRNRIAAVSLATLATAGLAGGASAINIPQGGAVTPGIVFIIQFQVTEGCDGQPTDRIEVMIPESVDNPIPQAVPGWDASVESVVVEGDGSDDESLVTLVSWEGGPLEADEYLEFGMRAGFPDDPGAVLEFPVTQTCGLTEVRWEGEDGPTPAPTVLLAQRFLNRDLVDLAAAVDEVESAVASLEERLGGVDPQNLRSRVSDNESAISDIRDRLDRMASRIDELEGGDSE